MKPKRPCGASMCPNLAESGEKYCKGCKAKGYSEHKEYKARRTDKKEQAIYKSARWKAVRGIRLRLNPLCLMCEKEGRITLAQMVDHIRPIKQGGAVYDLDNLQSLCFRHHNIKTASERKKQLYTLVDNSVDILWITCEKASGGGQFPYNIYHKGSGGPEA